MLYALTVFSPYVLVCFSLFKYSSLLKSSIKFCEWTNFCFFSTILAHLSSPKSIWISSLQVLTTCICFSLISCKSVYSKCALLLFLCCVLCISCVQLVQLLCEQIKPKQNSSSVGLMSHLEIFHVVLQCLLFQLASLLHTGEYWCSSSSWFSYY